VKVSFLKVSLYALFLRIFGLALTFRLMESGERDSIELYPRMLENPDVSREEKRR